MGLPDFLSDDEMDAAAGGGARRGGLPDVMDDWQMEQATQVGASRPSGPWLNTAKQAASGGIEGLLGLGAMLMDGANMMSPMKQQMGYALTGDPSNSMPFSAATSAKLAEWLPEKTKEDRYVRSVGQQGVGMLAGPGGLITRAASGLGAGVGAQGMEDLTKNHSWAPLIGAVGGGMLPSVASSGARALGTLFKPASADEIRGSAALALKGVMGDNAAAEIGGGVIGQAADDAGVLMTTAELTQNPGAAQLEKSLAASGRPAIEYAALDAQRIAARDAVLGRASGVDAINGKQLGESIINGALVAEREKKALAKAAWGLTNKDLPVDVTAQQAHVSAVIAASRNPLGMDTKTQTLLDLFLDPGRAVQEAGDLQAIRSEALNHLRNLSVEGKASSFDKVVLAQLADSITEAETKGFTGTDLEGLLSARALTKDLKQTYSPNIESKRKPVGFNLISEKTTPETALDRAFLGDERSVNETRRALSRPYLTDSGAAASQIPNMEGIKRGVIDSIPKDRNGVITPAKMDTFIKQNETGLKTLFGEDHFKLFTRVNDDLKSQASVSDLANLASKGQSATAQKTTVAGVLDNLLTEAIVPGTGKLATVAQGVKRMFGIDNKGAVKDLLWKAMMEPKFALELAQAPTDTRVLNVLEQFQKAGRDAALTGGKTGALSLVAPDGKPEAVKAIRSVAPSQKEPQKLSLLSELNPFSIKDANASIPTATSIFSKNQPLKSSVFSKLSKAVERVESGGKADAVSSKGAIGTHQVTPIAMREVMRAQGIDDKQFTNDDLTEMAKQPGVSKEYGDAYLNILLAKYDGDIELALAAYNAGPTAVSNLLKGDAETYADIRNRLPAETRAYVPKIKSIFEKA